MNDLQFTLIGLKKRIVMNDQKNPKNYETVSHLFSKSLAKTELIFLYNT
jgi:hypothetical protein